VGWDRFGRGEWSMIEHSQSRERDLFIFIGQAASPVPPSQSNIATDPHPQTCASLLSSPPRTAKILLARAVFTRVAHR